jgi:benzodiazapine receptor
VPPSRERRIAIALMAIQLVLNGLWSLLFFGLHSPGIAFVDIAALWIAIVATIVAFNAVRPAAAILMVPYVLWVSFAVVLNGSIWALNA